MSPLVPLKIQGKCYFPCIRAIIEERSFRKEYLMSDKKKSTNAEVLAYLAQNKDVLKDMLEALEAREVLDAPIVDQVDQSSHSVDTFQEFHPLVEEEGIFHPEGSEIGDLEVDIDTLVEKYSSGEDEDVTVTPEELVSELLRSSILTWGIEGLIDPATGKFSNAGDFIVEKPRLVLNDSEGNIAAEIVLSKMTTHKLHQALGMVDNIWNLKQPYEKKFQPSKAWERYLAWWKKRRIIGTLTTIFSVLFTLTLIFSIIAGLFNLGSSPMW